eukprot:4240551-Prymnesium_polylepis.1
MARRGATPKTRHTTLVSGHRVVMCLVCTRLHRTINAAWSIEPGDHHVASRSLAPLALAAPRASGAR